MIKSHIFQTEEARQLAWDIDNIIEEVFEELFNAEGMTRIDSIFEFKNRVVQKINEINQYDLVDRYYKRLDEFMSGVIE